MLPLYLKSSDAMARQTAIASVTKPINDRLVKCQKSGDREGMLIALQQIQAIRKRAGIKMTSQMLPLFAQGVLGFCGFKLMRACATLPVPGFADGGFLWLADLTLSDGFLIMPGIMALTMHMVARMGGETGAAAPSAMSDGMKKIFMYGMPVMIFAFTAFQPGAVAVWFASSGLIGVSQGLLLQKAPVREFFGLSPLYKPKAGETNGGVLDAFLAKKEPEIATKAGSKNSLYMNPTYQSPNLNKYKSSRDVIDTTLVQPKSAGTSTTAAADMIQPNAPASPKSSIFDSVREAGSNTWKQAKNMAKREQTEEQKKAKWKESADEYERRAQARGK